MLLLFTLLLLTTSLFGQAWSGILDGTRAVNWQRTSVGVPGGIPTNYTQCVNANCNTVTSAGCSATLTQVNSALSTAPASTYVLLPSCTFTFAGGIDMRGINNVILRGAGPTHTTLNFTADGIGGTFGGSIYAGTSSQTNSDSASAAPGGSNAFTWTSGFAQGATSLTVTNVGSTGIGNGDIIILDQKGDTSDTSGYIQCETTTPLACMAQNAVEGRIISSVPWAQEQFVKVTAGCASACSGAGPFTLTITPGLYANNWAQGNGSGNTGGWFTKPVVNVGIENLTVDDTNCPNDIGCNSGIVLFNCYGCWTKNIRVLNTRRNHVDLVNGYRDEIRDSYWYGTKNGQSQSYGIEFFPGNDSLVENNIFQKIASPIMFGGGAGNVIGYNFSLDDVFWTEQYLQGSYLSHSAGNYMNLFEGNAFNALMTDQLHGTGGLFTAFRNWLSGLDWNSCVNGAGSCDSTDLSATHPTVQTQPIFLSSYTRGINIIGNVLGTPGYHGTYQYVTPTNTGTQPQCNQTIYMLGYSNGAPVCGVGGDGGVADDSLVATTLMRWGNYDVVNAAVRWDSTESAPGAVTYISANSTPATHTLPNSFYLSSRPAFFATPQGTLAYPSIGPDLTGGNGGTFPSGTYAKGVCPVGKVSGGATCSSSLGGFANVNPAMNCYFNVLSGTSDGTGSALSFDAANCYTSSVSGSGTQITNTKITNSQISEVEPHGISLVPALGRAAQMGTGAHGAD